MMPDTLLWSVLLLPAVLGAGCLVPRSARGILILVSIGGAGWACLAGATAWDAFACGSLVTATGWLRLDALSAYHLAVLALVFGASSVYAWGYFRAETATGSLSRRNNGLDIAP